MLRAQGASKKIGPQKPTQRVTEDGPNSLDNHGKGCLLKELQVSLRQVMRTLRHTSLLAIALACLLPTAASAILPFFGSDPEAEISKVKIERIELGKKFETEDPMIAFERRYLLYRAYKSEDYWAREGKYYSIFWESDDRSPGLVVRFEYIQAGTEDEIHVKEVSIDRVKRRNVTKFEVVGEEFIDNGNVLAWRASLVRGDETVATFESFLWD